MTVQCCWGDSAVLLGCPASLGKQRAREGLSRVRVVSLALLAITIGRSGKTTFQEMAYTAKTSPPPPQQQGRAVKEPDH